MDLKSKFNSIASREIIADKQLLLLWPLSKDSFSDQKLIHYAHFNHAWLFPSEELSLRDVSY